MHKHLIKKARQKIVSTCNMIQIIKLKDRTKGVKNQKSGEQSVLGQTG